MDKKEKISVRVFLYQKKNHWVAQCVEYDIATQGEKKQDALDALERTILGQVVLDIQEGIRPLSETPPTPESCLKYIAPLTCIWQHYNSGGSDG